MRSLSIILPLLLLLLVLLQPSQARSRHRQMTVEVVAGSEECFYVENVKVGEVLDLEYQVIGSSAPTGQNDITVRVQSPHPSFKTLFHDEMSKQGNFNEDLQEEGDYRICLDNSRSRWSDKTVWFEIQVEDPHDDYDDDYMEEEDWEKIKAVGDDTEKLFDMTVEEIQNTVHSVRIRVNKIRHGSYLLGAHMSKDTNQVLANLERINFWSAVNLIVMIIVGITQVLMVKSFFMERSIFKSLVGSS